MDISKLKEKDREIAELIGIENYMRLVNQYGGTNIYIPALSTLKRNANSAEIKKRYNGNNADQLAKEYGLSVKTIIRTVTKKPMSRT